MGKLISINSFPQIHFNCGKSDTADENMLLVIDTLLRVMNEVLPIQSVSTTITIQKERECPACFKESDLIILNSNPSSWSRLAYQLAHEMCHTVIHGKVQQNLRWLEESICELSSYYFLPKLSEYWQNTAINLMTADGQLYYPCFKTYVENDVQKAIPFEISQLCKTPKTQLAKKLDSDPYLRDMNSCIANRLLPIFQSHPNTWSAVPLLCNISDTSSLSDALLEWISISAAECRSALIEISNIFGLSESIK